jgi:predicted nucleic acid-binding protein
MCYKRSMVDVASRERWRAGSGRCGDPRPTACRVTEALTLEPIAVDQSVAAAWARLRVVLRDMDKRMPVNDSWIAATAMSLGAPVVTQDDDYVDLPGLEIIQV